MARTVTLLQLRTWARQLSNTESDPNVTDSELTALANRHSTEVYDTLVDAGPPEYYASSTTVSVVSGTIAYALASDFRNLIDVYVHETDTQRRALVPMGEGQRGRYQAPTAAVTCTVEYIAAPGTMSADGDTFDGISGWEELIANLMARDVMIKREADPGAVMSTIGRLEGRVRSKARNRDRGHPKRVTDTDEQWTDWNPAATSVCVYRLRAGNLEIYEPLSRML